MHRKIMVICPHLPSPTGSGSIDNSGFGVQNQQEPGRNELNIFYTPPGISPKAGRNGPTKVCINFIPRSSTSASQQGGNAHLFFSVSAMRFTFLTASQGISEKQSVVPQRQTQVLPGNENSFGFNSLYLRCTIG